MALQPDIILGAARFDPVGALDRGATAANRQNAFARETAYNQAISQNGAAAMRGDVNAQNALAGFDPAAVQGLQSNALGMEAQQLGMQATRQNMDIQREELTMRREQARQEAAAALASQQGAVDAAKMAEEAAKARDLLVRAGRFHAEGNEAGYNLFLQQNGLDPAEYPMAEYRYIAATMEGVLDAVDAAAGPSVEPQSPEGRLQADIEAGIVPAGTVATPETVVNVGEGDKFYEALDKGQAEMFGALMTEGVQAGRTLGQIDRLEGLLANTPTGGEAAFKLFLGEFGVNTEGLDNAQAAQAIINQIVPQQRLPGSGPMSDADLALFKQSVPRIINQPGGNQIIINTMRGVAEYTRQQAEIAARVANREITPAEGRAALAGLQNPLENIGQTAANAPAATTAPVAPPTAPATPAAPQMSPEAFRFMQGN